MKLAVVFLVFLATFFISEARVSTKKLAEISRFHFGDFDQDLSKRDLYKRVVQTGSTTRLRTNAVCETTDYNRRYWKINSGTSNELLGVWRGTGVGWFVNSTAGSSHVLFTDPITDTWNITFEPQHGRIKWVDSFQPSSIPFNEDDVFFRYLQSNGAGGHSTCTVINSDDVPSSMDIEKDVFGLPNNLSFLINNSTGTDDATCSYLLPTPDTCFVSCIYYDTLVGVPPGTSYLYFLRMNKD